MSIDCIHLLDRIVDSSAVYAYVVLDIRSAEAASRQTRLIALGKDWLNGLGRWGCCTKRA